eukprot:COSAG01_NODE_1010_length_12149_cov_12.245892_1_plen_124_part_10
MALGGMALGARCTWCAPRVEFGPVRVGAGLGKTVDGAVPGVVDCSVHATATAVVPIRVGGPLVPPHHLWATNAVRSDAWTPGPCPVDPALVAVCVCVPAATPDCGARHVAAGGIRAGGEGMGSH